MRSKERVLAALRGEPADHVPLTTWCFGFPAPQKYRWHTAGRDVPYWYTKRLEYLHELPLPWTLDDDFKRAEAWLAMGIDDVLEVSVPWSQEPSVQVTDSVIPPGQPDGDPRYPVAVREYETPSGRLRHAVRRTGGEGPGWPIQPAGVALVEDYNIPRAVEHLVSQPEHVPAISHLFAPPGDGEQAWLAERLRRVGQFAEAKGLFVQAWTAFGMDAAVWFTGTEGAVMMAIDAPDAFGRLLETIARTDLARTELAARHEAVDMVCQRGWYSSTDFWSPALFDRYVFPYVQAAAEVAHRHGKAFAYTMTTGIERLGQRLIDAGVDLLFFVDPLLDRLSPQRAAELFGGRLTLVGGINSGTLADDPEEIRRQVRAAVEALGPTGRFILHPVDAIFPDTPPAGVETMIDAWREFV